MSPLVFVSLFVALSVLYVFARGLGQRPATKVKTAYLLFVGVMGATVLADFVLRLPLDPAITVPAMRATYAVFLSAGVLYLHFVYAVVSRRPDALFWIATALFGSCSLVSWAVAAPALSLDPHLRFVVMSLPTPTRVLIVVGVLLPGIAGLVLTARHYVRPRDEREKSIVGILLRGAAISLAIWFVPLAVGPVLFPGWTLPLQLLSLSLVVHVYHMHRAVTRHYFAVIDYAQIEEVSRSLFENVSEAAVVFGATGKVVELNGPARALLGDTVSVEGLAQMLDGYALESTYHDETMDLVTPHGKRAVLVSQTPIEKPGLRLGTLLLIRDMTEQVMLEEERMQMEERVRHAEKMEAVGQLAGGIAHDFNNQLMGISGYADLLREDVAGNKDLERLADNILRAARRSADLTAQLLAFARRGTLVNAPVDLDCTVADVVSLLSHSIDKRIAIRQERRADGCWTEGDSSQLQNAILNMALNARDAMSDGGTLTFETDVAELDAAYCDRSAFDVSPGRYASVKVIDTGTGIEAGILKHIFEPFFTTKCTTKGTGMGLAAVYGTVTSHRGAIDVVSAPGAGSTFTVYLPLFDGEKPVARGTPAAAVRSARTRGGHVLLVDDEQVVRETASAMLERLGYRVSTCTDGREAAETYAAKWNEFDAVILDVAMPRMSGGEVFDAMRRANPGVRVLVSSGYSVGGEVQQMLDAGARGFIQKPFRGADLAERVAELLGGGPGTRVP